VTRRDFLAVPAGAALAAAPARPPLCAFSKHLASLNYEQLAQAVKDLGFDGVDLTVRPKGHVLPERVAEDLPRAVAAIRAQGLEVPMITTDLTRAEDPAARPTLAAAARLRIPCWKVGYWRTLGYAEVRPLAAGLFALSKEYGVAAGLHNHSGGYYGSLPYEFKMILEGFAPEAAGYYFDARHAVAEGGDSGWKTYLKQALANLKMVAVKDFFWEKSGGKWRMANCPLGQGMVDWPAVLAAIAKSGFRGPVSLHVEYNPKDEREALASDLALLKKLVSAAYPG
jgi:sugar phosphate isomerase/epimerase